MVPRQVPWATGDYADERTGEIVLDIYTPGAEGTDVEALRQDAESRLGARLRVHMTTAKPILNPRNAPQ